MNTTYLTHTQHPPSGAAGIDRHESAKEDHAGVDGGTTGDDASFIVVSGRMNEQPRSATQPSYKPLLRLSAAAVPAIAAMHPVAADAYVGPGAGLTALGTVVALVLALVLALVGFVWYPLKRMARRRKAKSASRAAQERE